MELYISSHIALHARKELGLERAMELPPPSPPGNESAAAPPASPSGVGSITGGNGARAATNAITEGGNGSNSSSDGGAYRLYVVSVYWAFSTLSTVGYGDVSAAQTSEYIFSVVMMAGIIQYNTFVVQRRCNDNHHRYYHIPTEFQFTSCAV